MLKWFFKKMKRKIPEKGESWQFKEESPWPKKGFSVKILECKKGWVRYDMGDSSFDDERMGLSTFLSIYTFQED